jgi:hypothetical protein
MRHRLMALAALTLGGGCMTHQALTRHTVHTAATLTDVNYQQVLTNVALFACNSSAIPSFGVVNAGTVTVDDQKTAQLSAAYAPTITFAQQASAGPILLLTGGPTVQREITENWSLVPVTDADNLRRLRCAFQLLVADPAVNPCEDCVRQLSLYFAGQADDFDCLVPRGWYRTGTRKDVPRDACYVGCYRDTYVWVMPDGLEGLSRFTLTVLDLASGKLRLPQRTVQKTYKGDGTLESTQITTTEIDREALEKIRAGTAVLPERERDTDAPSVNRGLFFLPR